MSLDAMSKSGIDVELIAQRIMKLAEIATLEHLEALAVSQAQGLMELSEEFSSLEYGFDGAGA
ncbi:MAG TPA: hypothetical protein VM008_18705 [Phycisphaerae bacterium]|nr:hypothetical protein [Phycisphaerae bacterium]